MTYSQPPRIAARRRQTIDEALDHAVAIMGAEGVGALSISEVARRMEMRAQSLYKYFDSLNALYDALFARGVAAQTSAMERAAAEAEPGLERVRAFAREAVRWSIENPALAQLLYWRAVPGFEPSPEVFAGSIELMAQVRADLAGALAKGVDPDHAMRMLTILVAGLVSQQLANEPAVAFHRGSFSAMTEAALDMYLATFTDTPRTRRRTHG